MPAPSWMLLRLALETRDRHAPADEDRLALMDLTSLADYRTFLSRIWGFESAAELALSSTPAVASHVVGLRARVGRLRDDLLRLGMSALDVDTLPRFQPITIQTAAQALGWMFVLERSTLVAGLIKRHLAHQLPGATVACGYLDAYGTSAAERLRRFAETLGEHANRGTAQPDAIVAAATKAFDAQRQWYARAGLRSRSNTQPLQRIKPSAA